MRIEIEFDTLEQAIKGAFGLDIGSIVIVQHEPNGQWLLTNYNGVRRPGMFLVIDPGAKFDSAWTAVPAGSADHRGEGR